MEKVHGFFLQFIKCFPSLRSLQPASHSCGLPGWDSGHIRPVHTGPEAQVPAGGNQQQGEEGVCVSSLVPRAYCHVFSFVLYPIH